MYAFWYKWPKINCKFENFWNRNTRTQRRRSLDKNFSILSKQNRRDASFWKISNSAWCNLNRRPGLRWPHRRSKNTLTCWRYPCNVVAERWRVCSIRHESILTINESTKWHHSHSSCFHPRSLAYCFPTFEICCSGRRKLRKNSAYLCSCFWSRHKLGVIVQIDGY